MIIDPALRALRSDPASQRAMQAAMEQAKADALKDVGPVRAALMKFSQGAPLEECEGLAELFTSPGRAAAFTEQIVAGMVRAMRETPLGQVPFRHSYSGGFAVVQLAGTGATALSLVSIEGDTLHERPPARTLCFTDNERHEIVLAGEATGRIAKLQIVPDQKARFDFEAAEFKPGHVTRLSGPTETRLVDEVPSGLASLRLTRTPTNPRPTREFCLSDGALVHQASGNRQASRHEMALATLGRMGRSDAVPIVAEMACEQGDDNLRWQALRECLALDTAAGFTALCVVAADPADALAGPAGALRGQLIETYPQLGQLEIAACPA